MSKPILSSFPEYFSSYVNLVPEEDLMEAFENQDAVINSFFNRIHEEKSNESYAAGKWSIKELMQHLIDTERIFCYRALCIARNETQSLPGFDENEYAANSDAAKRSWKDLCKELKLVRAATKILFSSMSNERLNVIGLSNNKKISVLAIGFICIGHIEHHVHVIKERYL